MTRSRSIAAYLAKLGSPARQEGLAAQPKRPNGTIIWARCSDPDQVMAIETLGRKLSEDGDPVQLITTLPEIDPDVSGQSLRQPRGRDNIRAFINHWRPAMAIWVGGDLDLLLLAEMRNMGVRCILVDATADGLDHIAGRWIPRATRSLLTHFEAVLALDKAAADRLTRAGLTVDTVSAAGPMEDCAHTLPCDENARSEIARAIGTRPVWLAASAHMADCDALCQAQQDASKRAHRLLLAIVPKNRDDAEEFGQRLHQRGLNVALRSQNPTPSDIDQVYIIDTPDDLGLWYRIAPITYIGGTLHGGGCRDPFEAAALGSAVVYGEKVAPFRRHAARLNKAGASRIIWSDNDLGPAIESLLSADKTAQLAHAAWDETSRGADVTNRIVGMIQERLEEAIH